MRLERWTEVEALRVRQLPGMAVAQLVRRLGVSESSYWKGLKRGSAMQPATASVVNRRLRELLEAQ